MAKTRHYDKKELVPFVKGFKKASDIIRMEKPDYIFAPVVGAVPFVDILTIVDRSFPLNSVEYLPNSSRFGNRDKLMEKWYFNFYKGNEIDEPMKILCLDEVLSGASAVKGYKQFKKSINDRAKHNAIGMEDELEALEHFRKRLNKNMSYKILGIAEKGHQRCRSFRSLMNKKLVHLIDFESVFTIDNVSLNPVRLKPEGLNASQRMDYLPEIESFDINAEYLGFLKDIAKCVGLDPSSVNPVNLSKIEEDLKKSKMPENSRE